MTAGNVKPAKAIGYVRVSTEGQATGGIGLEAQRCNLPHYSEALFHFSQRHGSSIVSQRCVRSGDFVARSAA